MIKPVKYRQSKTIDQQNMAKYIVHHSKNLIARYSPISSHLNQTNPKQRQPIKKHSKILEVQDITSSAGYSLNSKTAFQNEHFSSRIRNRSASLSEFHLQAWDDICETRSKTIFKSFNSLKSLRRFELCFVEYQFPTTGSLHSLFKRLLFFKKMTRLSFLAFHCHNFAMRHLSALCSSLVRSPQLQSLTLVFNSEDQHLNILIPALPKLTSLANFCLSLKGESSIQTGNIQQLLLAFSTIATLTDITLHLNHCEINFETSSLEPLAEGLQYLNASTIRKLALDPYKNLTDKRLVRISQVLEKFTSLQILHLGLPSSQEITNEGLKQLSSTLNGFGSLTSLSLNFLGFTQDLALAFQSLQSLVSLKLKFQNPNPSQDQIQLLSSGLKARKIPLKFLTINFAEQSSLSDSMIESLASALEELSLLKHFSLNLTSTFNLTSKGIEALSFAIQRLSNLSSLSLILAKNQGIDVKAVSALSQALQGLSLLHSIELDLLQCYQLNSEGNGYQSFFSALNEMKNVCKLQLRLPVCPNLTQEVNKLKQRFDLRTYEFLNCLDLRTL